MARNTRAKKQKQRAERLVEQQAERRKKSVYRFEVTFSVNDAGQVYIADFLSSLPRGGASAFIREAVLEKMAREIAPMSASDEFAAMLNEIAQRLDNLPFGDMIDRLEDLQRRPAMHAERVIERVTERVAFSTPSPDDDDDIEMEIVAAENTNSGQNFLDSLLALNS
jgi:hypothetical protein